MVIVKNDTEFFKIYEDQGEYIILGPGEVKEMHEPQYITVNMSMHTATLSVRVLMGETVLCYCPEIDEAFFWEV